MAETGLPAILLLTYSGILGFGAALLGALIGGNRAKVAAIEGGRAAQEHAHRLASEEQREQLKRRLLLDAMNVVQTTSAIIRKGMTQPMAVDYLRTLILLWQGYMKDRDRFLVLRDDGLVSEVDSMYDKMPGLARDALRFERRMAGGRKTHGANHVDLPIQRSAYINHLSILRQSAVRVLKGIGAQVPDWAASD